MTAIAGIKHKNGVTIGGDSAAISNFHLMTRKDPKVFRVGRLLIGYTSSFRMAQLMRYGWHKCESLDSLVPPDSDDGMDFMCKQFVPRVRWLFKQGGYMGKTDDGREDAGEFLVSWGYGLYLVYSDLQVAESHSPYMACGCGRDVVLGALYGALGASGVPTDPEKLVRASLDAAERFSAGVRGPHTVLTVERKKPK